MRGKLLFIAGAAVGFVLGSKQGRQAYEAIKSKAADTWSNPKVRDGVSKAAELASEKIPGGEKIPAAVEQTTEKVDEAVESAQTGATDGRDEQSPTPTSATVANASNSQNPATSSNDG